MEESDLSRQCRLTRGGRPEHGPREILPAQHSTGRNRKKANRTLTRRPTFRRPLSQAFFHRSGLLFEGRDEKIFLAVKSSVERSHGDFRPGRHVPQSDGLEAPLLRQFNRRLDDPASARLEFLFNGFGCHGA